MNLLNAHFFCMVSYLCVSGAVGSWSGFCCLKKHSGIRLPVRNVEDCKVQSAGLCPFDAIIIRTRTGRTVCYDPKAEWVTKNVVMTGTESCNMTTLKKNTKNKKSRRGGKRGKRKGKQEKGSLN